MSALNLSCSEAWKQAFAAARADNKSSIKCLKHLTFEENQGVFIHKKVAQKLGHFFQGRFVELLKSVDESAADLRVGSLVDFSTDQVVGELKAQANTDNSSSKARNIQKLREASDGIKQMIYGYLRTEIDKVDNDIHYLGGHSLFSHFGISHLYTQFMEEIDELERQLFDVYREQFKQLDIQLSLIESPPKRFDVDVRHLPVKSFTVKQITIQEATPMIQDWHYSKSTNGLMVSYCFGLFF